MKFEDRIQLKLSDLTEELNIKYCCLWILCTIRNGWSGVCDYDR